MPLAADLAERWTLAASALGVDLGRAERDALLKRYAEPQRKYHTLRHLDECFARLDRVRARIERTGEVDIALFYHDAVYNPRASDNEARSAELALHMMERAGLGAEVRDRVRALIMATRHDVLPPPGDAALLVDVDLGILAAPPARFDDYETEVRAEYAWVPEPVFRAERSALLKRLLARQRIFASGAFDDDEARARENLARSLLRLA